ncbi:MULTISPECIES: TonB-dependent siderophore receptor [Vibrio]|uniref:Ligand-gated channel protein n=4 Tax=Vibrio TaxID=662 RepID=A0A7Z1MM34_9VIBR|nr:MULTISPECIES: TonB-dependent siderophore receptor [Vibrio]KNH13178.1 ligand-gated channel protein [Vibrio lentus]MBY7662358.1 TonB-dependent siderophore receptor [Vibrio atlanticus]KAA8598115.1 Ferrichrome-iron receptor [Vibrio cyclitrophicus]MBE8604561.1 TonB-dependent siderophore receptor [Vibrio sp. OPT10]MCC4774536.1 TonB-dependent siderophore receptor [Vibrio cyclitrophicus]|tara:strand:- start:403 stop:2526 length:2124 start_codon:yes stop_codon:yes gene_type:complete
MTTHTRFKYSSLAVALLTAFSTQALAEDTITAADSNIETVTIMGKAYRNTATKSALEPEETPQGITVIDEAQLEQRGVQSLNQALRYAPGVVTENRGGSVAMFDSYSIRGFKTNNVNYYDGLSLQQLNGWNLQPQIDPIAMQQVEIFKGPTSVLYGAMPPGGMVNMIAKAPQTEKSTKVGVATGSRNLQEASIDTTGQFGDSDFSYRLIALARKQDSQVDNAEEERYLIAPSVDWQATDSTLINFNLYYQNDPSMGINSSMPLDVLKASNPSVSMGDKNWSKFEREVLMVGYKINHDFNNNWTFLQNARYTDASLYQENTYHVSYDSNTPNQLSRYLYSTDESFKGFVIDNQLSGLIKAGSIEHNVLVGIDYQNMDGDVNYSSYSANGSGFNSFDPLNPNNDLLDRSDVTKTGEYLDDTTSSQLGLYLQDQVRLDALVLIAGARFDHYKSESDYYAHESDHKQFTYRVGGLYELNNGLSPFASYATSFEPAPGVDKSGNEFDPEMAQQAEIGVKYLSDDMSKEATVSLFHIVKQDMLMTDPTNVYGPRIQVGEVVSQGAELSGRWFATENFDIAAAYTYVDMEITEDTSNGLEGTTPIYVPEHTANLWANYNVFNGMLAGSRFSAGARYVGEMQMDASNTQGKVPAYTVVDLSVGYDLGAASDTLSGATANLAVNNIFNEEYYACYDQSNCWFGAEQSVELSVNYEF